jgi:hypothetical protein
LLTRAVDGLGEDVAYPCRVLAEDVRVNARGYGRVGMAKAGGDHMDRTPARSKVVACRWRRSWSRAWGSGLAGGVTDLLCRLIILAHERGHGVGIEHDGSRTAKGDLGCVEVDGFPAEVEKFAAPCAGVGGQAVEGE